MIYISFFFNSLRHHTHKNNCFHETVHTEITALFNRTPQEKTHCSSSRIHFNKFCPMLHQKEAMISWLQKFVRSCAVIDGDQKMVKCSDKSTKIWCDLGRIFVASKSVLLFGVTQEKIFQSVYHSLTCEILYKQIYINQRSSVIDIFYSIYKFAFHLIM